MKKKLILLGFMLLLCSFITQGSHRHRFGDWCFETMPTCAEYGIEARVCICGEVDLRQIPPSEAHTFGEWSACQYSVCPANQKEERICSVCSGREIRYAAVQGEHIYDKATVEKNATCTESGEIHLYCNCGEYKSEIIPAEQGA